MKAPNLDLSTLRGFTPINPDSIGVKSGFTLIELIVVIAILGILAVVLITIIDPLDKINAANDAGVISSIAQFGKANDSYAATHNNTYVGNAILNTVDHALTDLKTDGETKIATYTPPSGYTVSYAATKADGTPCSTPFVNCTNYAFWVTPLKSKKYLGPPNAQVYVWANGKGCNMQIGTVITATTTC